MLQPVLGDVGVEVRIVDHCRKAENKPQAQPHGYEACPQKKPRMLPQQLTHRANIARLLQSRAEEKDFLWTRRCQFLVDCATLCSESALGGTSRRRSIAECGEDGRRACGETRPRGTQRLTTAYHGLTRIDRLSRAAYDEVCFLMAESVFYDPRRARWKPLRRFFDAFGVALSLLVIFFVYTALRGEPLPELLLSPQKRAFRALKESEKEKARDRQRKLASRTHRKSKLAPSQVKLNQEEGIRAAFYVPWDAASFSSLRDFARQIDILYPEWLHVLTADGRVQGVDDQTNKFFDVVQGDQVRPVDDRVMPFLKTEGTNMDVFPMVNNFDGANWVGGITEFLNNPAARLSFRQQISRFLSSDRYRGLMVDFEAFPESGQAGYVALLQELSADLHGRGMKLYVAVPPRNKGFDYATVAAAADGVVLMNYDEHYPGAEAGPVASQDWFVQNLTAVEKVIPKEKIICAIANYGYDWVSKPKNGILPAGEKDSSVTPQDAWLAARAYEVAVKFGAVA